MEGDDHGGGRSCRNGSAGLARQEALSVAAGLIPPTAIFLALALVWAFNRVGLEAVAPVWWWIGPLLVYVLADPRPRLRGGRAEPARRGYGTARERSVLPLVQLRVHPAADRHGGGRVLPVVGGRPELARDRRGPGPGLEDRSRDQCRVRGRDRHQTPRTKLGHKKDDLERWLSKITLAQSFYGHFYIEHNRATTCGSRPPRTPRVHASGRASGHSSRAACGAVCGRPGPGEGGLERLGKGPWTIRNDVLNAWLMSVVLFGAMIAIFGWEVAPFLLLQAVLGSPCWRPSTISSTTGCCGSAPRVGVTNGARPLTAGTAITSAPTSSCTTCSGTATTTPTRRGATRRCGAWTSRRTCRAGTPA